MFHGNYSLILFLRLWCLMPLSNNISAIPAMIYKIKKFIIDFKIYPRKNITNNNKNAGYF